MLEYDDFHRRRMADLHSSITSLVGRLDVIAPALDSTLDLEETPLSGNQAIDAETAAAGGLVLATEDCLEARILDCLEAPARCSVYALLVASGCGLHALGHVAAKLSEWGADPCVDINVAESASSIEFRDVRPIRGTVKGGEAAGAALAWRHVN